MALSHNNGTRAGVLFISPQGYKIPKAYKMIFPCTNNVVKYERLTNGIKLVIKWKIE